MVWEVRAKLKEDTITAYQGFFQLKSSHRGFVLISFFDRKDLYFYLNAGLDR